MVDVARGRRALAELLVLLESPGGGLETSPPAPPQGLFLSEVEYPEEVWPSAPEREREALIS